MKQFIYQIAIILCIVNILFNFRAQSQTPVYYMEKPEGFAAEVTGGGAPTADNTITVSTATDLSTALTGNKSVILVSGTITTSRISAVVTNKSIIGLPGARLITTDQTTDGSGILHLKTGSSNVIIRNLIFEGPGAYDCDGWDLLTNKGCNKLWVDHCDFQDGLDDCFDNSNSADNITVSWCKFSYLKPYIPGGPGGADDHRYANLVGGSDSDAPSDGHYSITWQNCWWAAGILDRMVRARNAELHIVNCYWTSQEASNNINLTGGIKGTTCYVEKSVFASSGRYAVLDGTQTMSIQFSDCTGAKGAVTDAEYTKGAVNAGLAVAPTYTYSSVPATRVVSAIKSNCGAGATLQVSSEGIISTPSCIENSIIESIDHGVDLYPVMVNNTLNIDFNGYEQYTRINIFSATGRKVFSLAKRIFSGEQIVLNLQKYNQGVYFVHIENNSNSFVKKIIKK